MKSREMAYELRVKGLPLKRLKQSANAILGMFPGVEVEITSDHPSNELATVSQPLHVVTVLHYPVD